MFIAQFFMASSKKKNETDNFNSLGAREGGKKCQKRVKNEKKKIFFGGSKTNIKCDTCIFEGLFKNIVFRSEVTLVTKKLWAILDFFSQTGLFFALYPTL